MSEPNLNSQQQQTRKEPNKLPPIEHQIISKAERDMRKLQSDKKSLSLSMTSGFIAGFKKKNGRRQFDKLALSDQKINSLDKSEVATSPSIKQRNRSMASIVSELKELPRIRRYNHNKIASREKHLLSENWVIYAQLSVYVVFSVVLNLDLAWFTRMPFFVTTAIVASPMIYYLYSCNNTNYIWLQRFLIAIYAVNLISISKASSRSYILVVCAVVLISTIKSIPKHELVKIGLLLTGFWVLFILDFSVICFQTTCSPVTYEIFITICSVALFGLLFVHKMNIENNGGFDQLNKVIFEFSNRNAELQHRLRVAKIQFEGELAVPLNMATYILMCIKNDLQETNYKREIEEILAVLNTDNLYEPDIFKDTGDVEVTNFLQDVLQSRSNSRKYISKGKTNKGMIPTKTSMITSIRVDHCLETFSEPFFDVLELEVASQGQALTHVALTIFQEQNFQQGLGISQTRFMRWVKRMETGYDTNNSYHNSTHAADVTHCMNFFTTRPKISQILSEEEMLACLVAAISHDYRHPGVTNSFLITTGNQLALLYNDTSVLENFHAACVFEMMEDSLLNFLQDLDRDQIIHIREIIISMILATDMAFHFEWLGKFKSKLSTDSFNFDNLSDKKLMLNLAMKCADVNNLCKPLQLSKKWTQMIMDEFFFQGDQERILKMPISTFMDRNTTDISKCQLGFIDYIVFPLYETWAAFFEEDLQQYIVNLNSTKEYWKSVSDNHTPIERFEIPSFKAVKDEEIEKQKAKPHMEKSDSATSKSFFKRLTRKGTSIGRSPTFIITGNDFEQITEDPKKTTEIPKSAQSLEPPKLGVSKSPSSSHIFSSFFSISSPKKNSQ